MQNIHPADAENHAFCSDCNGEYELTRHKDDWLYHCAQCKKMLTSAQYRAEIAPQPHGDDDQIAEAFFDADEPTSQWENKLNEQI